MTRFKPYSRRVLSRRRRAWARRNARLIFSAVCGLAGLLAFVTVVALWAWPATPIRSYAIGFVHAAMIATTVFLLEAAFLAHDRDAIGHVRGAWGEENTTSELKRARRKRLIWGWVDAINLRVGDLDHVVVTCGGGLIAIDSKFRNQIVDPSDMATAARRAGMRAEALARTLLSGEGRVRHRGTENPLAVTPIVVIWGAAQADVPDAATFGGIEFVAGRNLLAWLERQSGRPVSRAAAKDLVERLQKFRLSAWSDGEARDQRRSPMS